MIQDRPLDLAFSIRSFIRFRQRENVVFPHPEGPISAVISLRAIEIVTSRMAGDPYETETSSTSKTCSRSTSTTSSPVARRTSNRCASGSVEADGWVVSVTSISSPLPLIPVPQQDRRQVDDQDHDQEHHDRRGGEARPPHPAGATTRR